MAKKGIDVSHHNGNIDWAKVKAERIQFAVLRAGYGKNGTDTQFETNYTGARAAGLPVGTYWYSYATEARGARQEASRFLSVIHGKRFDLPVFLDLEEASAFPNATSIVNAFCGEIASAGYQAGLYMSRAHFGTYVRSTSYYLWLAEWSSQLHYTGSVGMWQYSDSGRVNGISGAVDLDYCYTEYQASGTVQPGKAEAFIQKAQSQIGKTFKGKSGNPHNCSADFVVCCADEVGGLTGVLIPDCRNPGEFAQKGINASMGALVSSARGNAKAGDIILLRTKGKPYRTRYDCDEIGIVVETRADSVIAVVAESAHRVQKKSFAYGSSICAGFYRPGWSKVEATASASGYGKLGKYYDTQNTEEDATLREVGYLSGSYAPTTAKSNIRVSVVNYTTLMSAVMDNLLVPAMSASDDVILDGVSNQNAKIIIQELMSKGLNAAATVGICANIYHESNYNPSIYEIGKSDHSRCGVGLCQWTGARNPAMKAFVGPNWANNVSGQVDFLYYELSQNPGYGLSQLQAVPNTEEGARKAADIFVRKFERPANVNARAVERQATASKIWKQIVIQENTIASGSGGILNASPVKGKEVVIPTSVQQTGISANYTNYSYWFSRWGQSSIQRKIANRWDQQGRPSNRGIATVDGLFLCAVTLIFGTTGDKISIVLQNGSVINALIADSKGDNPSKHGEPGNAYGHTLSGKVDVIEWERVGSATSASAPNPIDLNGWKGQRVVKIINGGAHIT